MLKFLLPLALLTTSFSSAFAAPADVCKALKSMVAESLVPTCKDAADVAAGPKAEFDGAVTYLAKECGEAEFSQMLAQALVYKTVHLNESCLAVATVLLGEAK